MILSFFLSMPNIGSWDGRWTGENNLYAKVVNFGRSKKGEQEAKEILNNGRFYYNFGDGWVACVTVKQVDSKEANKIRKITRGFCGYDWMIKSIRENGKIEC